MSRQPPSGGFPAEGGLIGRPFYGRLAVAHGLASLLWVQPVSTGLPEAEKPVETGSKKEKEREEDLPDHEPAVKRLAYLPFGKDR